MGPSRVDAGGVLGEVALFGNDVEAAKQRQPLIGNQRHDVALALDGPELEREAGAEGMGGGDHLGAGELGRLCEGLKRKAAELGQKEKQTAAGGGKRAGSEGEGVDAGGGFDTGAHALGALLIQASRQRCKAFSFQELADP